MFLLPKTGQGTSSLPRQAFWFGCVTVLNFRTFFDSMLDPFNMHISISLVEDVKGCESVMVLKTNIHRCFVDQVIHNLEQIGISEV